MTFLCIGNSVIKEAKVVSYLDLILATIGIFFGLLALTYPNSIFFEWDVFSYRINLYDGMNFADIIITVSTVALLSIYILEIFLFFIFNRAIRKLDGKMANTWYKIRFGFFILSIIITIYRTIDMQNMSQSTLIIKGIIGIILLLYRGYALLIVTFLEEQILKHSIPPNTYNNYFKL